MPVLKTLNSGSMTQHLIGGTSFEFSAVGLDRLGATEYTLVGIVIDTSSSVYEHKSEIERIIKTIVQSCRYSPRSDNLMLRMLFFDSETHEVHGYKLLTECRPDDYLGTVDPGGMTALCDASFDMISSLAQYGSDLSDHDYDVNAILFVVTDGEENNSQVDPLRLQKALSTVRKSEKLQSIRSILIGLSVDKSTDSALAQFKDLVGFDQYIGCANASESTIARVADFITRSISAQSVLLSTGGASQSLTF